MITCSYLATCSSKLPSSAGHLLGVGVNDPIWKPPSLPLPTWLDAPPQARLHEVDHHPRGQGHDLHQAGLPGHRTAHQQAGGADKQGLSDFSCFKIVGFLATLVALHFTPVSKWVGRSFGLA